MSNSEIESISNGLDRCTMLLQNIMDQPDNNNQVMSAPVTTVSVKRMQKPKPTVRILKPACPKKKIISKKISTLRGRPNKTERKAASSGKNIQPVKTTKFDKAIPSSTPIATPIKKEKLITQGKTPKQVEGEVAEPERPPSRSNSNPPSISSSQCSLIELLQMYNHDNTSPPQAIHLSTSQQSEDKNVSNKSTERTLTPTPEPDIEDKLTILQKENVALQRQLRVLKSENKLKLSDNINLEVASLQCTNASLQKKVSDLSKALEQTIKIQQQISDTNELLMEQNENLQKEISVRNDELRKSGKLFSSETEQIKQDVGDALSKVEILKQNLNETNEENLKLAGELQNKEVEVDRLNQLNRGLQSSVSRLLQDLNTKSLAPQSGENMSNFVLQKLGSLLSAPSQLKVAQPMQNPASAPPGGNEAAPGEFKPGGNVLHQLDCNPKTFFIPDFNDFNPHPPSLNKFDPQLSRITPNPILFQPTKTSPRQNENLLVLPPNPQTSTGSLYAESSCYVTNGSVSSSMLSMTSQDENNFNLGLASLDADIKKLQDSMRGMTS